MVSFSNIIYCIWVRVFVKVFAFISSSAYTKRLMHGDYNGLQVFDFDGLLI